MSPTPRRVTVCWHPAAEDTLAEVWQTADEARTIARAANEIDQLLRVSPSSRGTSHALARLSDEQTQILLERTGVLPEGLRSLTCGPLKVYFTPHEEDGQARIWIVEPRLK